MLIAVAILCGAGCALLGFKGAEADSVGQAFAFPLAALAGIVALAAVANFVRHPLIGAIDDTGVSFTFWGVGRIPWVDIECFSVDADGEGGRLICLHLRDEMHYLSRASVPRGWTAWLRRSSGFSAFVISPLDTDQRLDAVITEIRRHIPERAREA